ncbi:hypothetical protein [Streptomyces avicenniae]|uniref:hypothetical protein n=1 Tax=Streptomyces avicenniae TaxID=500153 RepID=UPI00069CA4E2|nr:hypothetical protein [Streptomyces avicenniae]
MAAGTVPAELPQCPKWVYGGFPYGLEPLTLPAPDEPSPSGKPDLVPFENARELVERAGGAGGEDVEPDTVLWFRWITGHQVSFTVWRLMAWLIHDVEAGLADRRDAPAALVRYVRGYSAMLRYSSSCPQSVYRDLIRPTMYRQHPAFSGGWAPDYPLVRGLFRGRPPSWLDGPGRADVLAAVADYQVDHAHIAARLVPGGHSLLRDSVAAQHPRPPQPLPAVLYDNYFMTLRAPIDRGHVVAQLLRRLLALVQDLAAHPPGGGTELLEAIAGLAREAVAGLARDQPVVLR